MVDMEGTRVLVTGGARGIGAACVAAYQRRGAHVFALDKNFSGIDDSFTQIDRVSRHFCDITDEKSVEDQFDEFGEVDIIVNCAGIVADGSIINCTFNDFKNTLDVNVAGSFLISRSGVRKALEGSKPLSIVNISSVISSIASAPNRLAYATSKAALIGMTKSIALDFIENNIRCNAVCPGTIDTPSLRSRIKIGSSGYANEDDAINFFNKRQPIGRMGTAQEIAELILFVSGNSVPFMTGSVITADGGFAL